MKFSPALAALATAQFYTNQSAPFTLRLASDSPALDGQVLEAAHIGAAIEGLAFFGTTVSAPSTTFFLNSTRTSADPSIGALVWTLHGGDGLALSSALSFLSDARSNVVYPLFAPGAAAVVPVGFDAADRLFVREAAPDDAAFVSGVEPAPSGPAALYQWHACWTDYEGYYYPSLAWVSYGPPRNPTCEPVNVTRTLA
ncbi:hypothetical protein P8C59_004515 [Phyllachora maydis]|uniref:Uncharacterized protein n=1 Tax=Phyllachora maydis TaxID=1825666 RepID=A0AAD9MEH0_9PEZI|nr:hypothetical protein P8C59_004515 [Phyllachora maydis]